MRSFRILSISQLVLALLLTGILVQSCRRDSTTMTDLTVRANIFLEGAPLVLVDKQYSNEGGVFVVEQFKMYLSNFVLYRNDGAVFVEPESYHLIRQESGVEGFEFVMTNVPTGTYESISFAVGVDTLRNTSIDNVGDLDPANQMAWNWNIGYKFILLEGRLTRPDNIEVPLVYHIGYGENFHEILSNTIFQVFSGGESFVEIDIIVDEMFQNPNTVNMAELNSVKFSKQEVDIIAENFKNGMVSFRN